MQWEMLLVARELLPRMAVRAVKALSRLNALDRDVLCCGCCVPRTWMDWLGIRDPGLARGD